LKTKRHGSETEGVVDRFDVSVLSSSSTSSAAAAAAAAAAVISHNGNEDSAFAGGVTDT